MAQTELRRMENLVYAQSQARILAQIQLNSLLDDPTETRYRVGPAKPLACIYPPRCTISRRWRMRVTVLWISIRLPEADQANYDAFARSRSGVRTRTFNLMAEREEGAAGPAGHQIGISMTFPLVVRAPLGVM